jgi:RimJ/RimL family protein N-acetyltransferase
MINNTLTGKLVTLRPATLEDRRPIYDWATQSDITRSMIGLPTFPDNPIPTWEEFCDDYKPYFFDGSAPQLGRCYIILVNQEPVGQVNSNDIEVNEGIQRVEMDIWLRAEIYCGKGYGSDALLTLCEYMARQMGVQQFMVQPSARNPRGIRAYEKIGFIRLPFTTEEARKLWGPSDYYDSVYMVKTIL